MASSDDFDDGSKPLGNLLNAAALLDFEFRGLEQTDVIERDGRGLAIRLLALRDVDQHIDGPDEAARSIEQWRRIGEKRNPCSVLPFGHGLLAPNGPLLFERHRHRGTDREERCAASGQESFHEPQNSLLPSSGSHPREPPQHHCKTQCARARR